MPLAQWLREVKQRLHALSSLCLCPLRGTAVCCHCRSALHTEVRVHRGFIDWDNGELDSVNDTPQFWVNVEFTVIPVAAASMGMRGGVTVAALSGAMQGVEANESVPCAGAADALSLFNRGREQSSWPDLPASIVTARVPHCTAGIQQIITTPLHHHAVALG